MCNRECSKTTLFDDTFSPNLAFRVISSRVCRRLKSIVDSFFSICLYFCPQLDITNDSLRPCRFAFGFSSEGSHALKSTIWGSPGRRFGALLEGSHALKSTISGSPGRRFGALLERSHALKSTTSGLQGGVFARFSRALTL